MIFPTLTHKKFGYLNLNFEGKRWAEKRTGVSLVNPKTCERMVLDVHKQYGIDFSYGGWMEDRSFLWHGSYLDVEQAFIHLGIDLNVPAGTPVSIDFDAVVVRVDDDFPEDGGWGPRVIVRHGKAPVYMIYAHLDRRMRCKVGDKLKKGAVFAKVGKAPYNGNWFPHLHVQTVSKDYFAELEKNDAWADLDGYGKAKDVRKNAVRFTDPMQYISLR